MTILANTQDYYVEFEAGFLSITRRTDGYCLDIKGKGIAGQFRACLKTHSQERVIQTFIRMARNTQWKPLYKPHRIPPYEQA